MTPTLVALFALAGSTASTARPEWCPNRAWERDHLRLSSHWHPHLEKCSVSVGRRDSEAPARAFTFSGDGRLMVFDTYEPEDDSGRTLLEGDPDYERFNTFDRVTAARVFWLFPRVSELEVQIARHSVVVGLTNGGRLVFDTLTGRIAQGEGVALEQAKHVERGQAGGVELSGFDGLVLDAGYRLGGDPTSLRARSSVVYDAHGGACDLPNRIAFRYGPKGEPTLRFGTDADLLRYLRRLKRSTSSPACKALRLGGLAAQVAKR